MELEYMDTFLHYKGYTGRFVYDDRDKLLHGIVIKIKDVITFQSKNLDNIKKAFENSVDDYLDFCKERGEKPEQPQ